MSESESTKSLREQESLLELRERKLATLEPGGLAALNNMILLGLEDLSPARLAPILIQCNNEGFVAAYLLQRVGEQGYRFLVRGAKWYIRRARRNAQILKVRDEHLEDFQELIGLQEKYMGSLFEMYQQCVAPSRSRDREQKRA